MTGAALETVSEGEELRVTLLRHAQEAAARAIAKLGGPLSAHNLGGFLADSDCAKHPIEIVYDAAPLEPHQFAQPVVEGGRCALYVHPHYAGRPECLPVIVAYMAGAINYGSAVTLDLCEEYGAALMGTDRETFYGAVCGVADELPLDLLLSR